MAIFIGIGVDARSSHYNSRHMLTSQKTDAFSMHLALLVEAQMIALRHLLEREFLIHCSLFACKDIKKRAKNHYKDKKNFVFLWFNY